MLEPAAVVIWVGFNCSLQSDDNWKPRANIGIVPLFPDKAASVLRVKHSLLLGKSLTDYFNPGQTPVQGMDHPTYAIRSDQIEVFKILNGYENIDRNIFFTVKEERRTSYISKEAV